MLSALLLFFVVTIFLIMLGRGGQYARFSIRLDDLKKIISGGHDQRWSAVNRLLYWLLFILFGLSFITGATNYFSPLAKGSETVEMVHRVSSWGYLVFLVLHVTSHLFQGGFSRLLSIVSPSMKLLPAAAMALLIAMVVVGAMFSIERQSHTKLAVKKSLLHPQSMASRVMASGRRPNR
jgi:hypothetical protein